VAMNLFKVVQGHDKSRKTFNKVHKTVCTRVLYLDTGQITGDLGWPGEQPAPYVGQRQISNSWFDDGGDTGVVINTNLGASPKNIRAYIFRAIGVDADRRRLQESSLSGQCSRSTCRPSTVS